MPPHTRLPDCELRIAYWLSPQPTPPPVGGGRFQIWQNAPVEVGLPGQQKRIYGLGGKRIAY